MRALAILALLSAASLAAQERQPGEYPLGPDSRINEHVAYDRLLGPWEFHS